MQHFVVFVLYCTHTDIKKEVISRLTRSWRMDTDTKRVDRAFQECRPLAKSLTERRARLNCRVFPDKTAVRQTVIRATTSAITAAHFHSPSLQPRARPADRDELHVHQTEGPALPEPRYDKLTSNSVHYCSTRHIQIKFSEDNTEKCISLNLFAMSSSVP